MKTPNVLAETHEWFVRAVPKPEVKNLTVQCGVHVEEVVEFLQEMQTSDEALLFYIVQARKAMTNLGNYLKKEAYNLTFSDREATLDAICDQLVTATGVARMLDMDPVAGLAEVNRSNWSKFVNGEPQFTEHGKIMKGPDYSEPNLSPFV